MPTEYEYTWAAWAEAFTIFAKYEPDIFANVSAEHDELYAGPATKVSDEDKKRLEELGWTYKEGYESFHKFV